MRTKRGFTLIEIIIVIAIIGVLAAILVPAMLGYIKKSKLRSADLSAETVARAANSALEELSENDCDFETNQSYHHLRGADFTDPGDTPVADDPDTLYTYMADYCDDLMGMEFALFIKDGVCIVTSAASGKYYGTYPQLYTNKNYGTEYDPQDAINALGDALAKYTENHSDTEGGV